MIPTLRTCPRIPRLTCFYLLFFYLNAWYWQSTVCTSRPFSWIFLCLLRLSECRQKFCIFCPKLTQCLLWHKGTQQIKPCIATAETFYMQSSLGFFLVLQLALSKRWCPGLLSFLFFIFSHWNLKIQRIGSSLSPPFVKVNIIMIRGD